MLTVGSCKCPLYCFYTNPAVRRIWFLCGSTKLKKWTFVISINKTKMICLLLYTTWQSYKSYDPSWRHSKSTNISCDFWRKWYKFNQNCLSYLSHAFSRQLQARTHSTECEMLITFFLFVRRTTSCCLAYLRCSAWCWILMAGRLIRSTTYRQDVTIKKKL